MTGLRTPPRPAPSLKTPLLLGILALAVLAAILGIGVASLTEGKVLVPRVTVDNTTVYNLQVDVGAPGSDQRLGLGTVRREGSRTFEQVLDQGDRWVFHLSFAGDDVGHVEVPRTQLERDGWRVQVPNAVGHTVAEDGHPPSAF